ncbi:MAG: hypothetical protein LBL26_00050, partial [Peptococcaceae bacterium]|nr:hypothetical protein [Peptococcaceae bacterium]
EEFGIRHLAFLQPCAFSGDYRRGAEEDDTLRGLYDITPEELDGFAALFGEQYSAVPQAAGDYGYIADFSALFDGETGVYTDACNFRDTFTDKVIGAALRYIGEDAL